MRQQLSNRYPRLRGVWHHSLASTWSVLFLHHARRASFRVSEVVIVTVHSRLTDEAVNRGVDGLPDGLLQSGLIPVFLKGGNAR